MAEHSTRCPRCGYDLTGLVASWRDACPLEGKCAECGLDISYREVLNPRFSLPPWCVEQDARWRVRIGQLLRNTFRCFRPGRMWSSIRMSHPYRPARILVWLTVLVILTAGLLSAGTGTLVWRNLDPSSTGGTLNFDRTAATVRAVLLPLSGQSPGQITVNWSGQVFTYPVFAPADLTRGVWFAAFPPAAILLGTNVAAAIAFAALPISRRRAKVRARHIVRVALYGFSVYIPVLWVAIVAAAAGHPWSGPALPGANLVALLAGILLVATPILHLWWWLAAIRSYLRMDHPWAVAVSVILIGWIAPVSCAGSLWLLLGSPRF